MPPQGLPPASKNQHAWPLKRPLLSACAAYKPTPATIAAASSYFRALLRTRYSSPLFRLPDPDHIRRQIKFENTGPDQIPGLIAVCIASSDSPSQGTFDREFDRIVVVVNARPEPAKRPYPQGVTTLELHPALQEIASSDADVAGCRANDVTGVYEVAARVAAVFVQRRRSG